MNYGMVDGGFDDFGYLDVEIWYVFLDWEF